jgi:CRP-like cAMP-binding protein
MFETVPSVIAVPISNGKPGVTSRMPSGNLLIDALPETTRRAFESLCKRLVIRRGKVTTLAGDPIEHVDFPVTAVLSAIAVTADGRTVEVTTIGNEGYVETDAPLESTLAQRSAVCRVSGTVMRIGINDFRAFLRTDRDFVHLIRRATRVRIFVTEQLVLCNAYHTMDQRLARWLLISYDYAKRERLRVTQVELAGVLGVRRAGISLAITRLKQLGTVTNEHGAIIVADRDRLLAVTCECYAIMREAIEAHGPAAA